MLQKKLRNIANHGDADQARVQINLKNKKRTTINHQGQQNQKQTIISTQVAKVAKKR